MKSKLATLFRLLLGSIFLGAGFNGYWVWLGYEPIFPTSPIAEEFLGTGYFLVIEKMAEVVLGILLIVGRFVPLALVAAFPLIVNILAFHIFADPELLPLALLLCVMEIYLLWVYKNSLKGLLQAKAPMD